MAYRFLLIALLLASGTASARPAMAPTKSTKVAITPAPIPVCTPVRKKAFHPVEGWSVKTVTLACKTVAAAVRQPGNKSFTSLPSDKGRQPK
ncbi:hypothetical protein [Methylobacterium iners]|uniref:Uncharacterized protein n=1 Tax=Methylobacterium iners TaxID=418707 RepID=A0ABQ4RVD5_9HYPH|nr:hypothetical protein [Methylobacterium iners]GJD94760.1 hypothetical protein OCOJLMKI_1964 [Methylobacterium iners]